jgi:hypothetical protein
MKKIIAWSFAVLTAAAAATGCTANVETTNATVPDRAGSVTFRWSVDSSFDPRACDAFAVANARFDIYDANGAPIATHFTDCRNFTATFDLAPGRYSARIQMVDSGNQPRSTSLAIAPFTIISGTNLSIDSDFPRDSFF